MYFGTETDIIFSGRKNNGFYVGKTVYYVTFDLQPFLCAGENTVEIWLGNGQYTGFLQNPVMAMPDCSELPEHRYQKNDGLVADGRICGEKKVIA